MGVCPICNGKTRIKARPDRGLENLPLFCPECKRETIVHIQQFNTSGIKESDAEPITGRDVPCGYRLF